MPKKKKPHCLSRTAPLALYVISSLKSFLIQFHSATFPVENLLPKRDKLGIPTWLNSSPLQCPGMEWHRLHGMPRADTAGAWAEVPLTGDPCAGYHGGCLWWDDESSAPSWYHTALPAEKRWAPFDICGAGKRVQRLQPLVPCRCSWHLEPAFLCISSKNVRFWHVSLNPSSHYPVFPPCSDFELSMTALSAILLWTDSSREGVDPPALAPKLPQPSAPPPPVVPSPPAVPGPFGARSPSGAPSPSPGPSPVLPGGSGQPSPAEGPGRTAPASPPRQSFGQSPSSGPGPGPASDSPTHSHKSESWMLRPVSLGFELVMVLLVSTLLLVRRWRIQLK